jgi:hypothetical protein
LTRLEAELNLDKSKKQAQYSRVAGWDALDALLEVIEAVG